MRLNFQEIKNLLYDRRSVIVTSHIHPDGDAIGASLAMYHYLRSLGNDVRVILDDQVPECYSVLPGADVIEPLGREAPTADLLILLDARPGRSGSVEKMVKAPVLNIDHHVSNDGKADYLLLDAERSSTCELLYCMFRDFGAAQTEEIAMNLYTGIATDTGFFRFENTTADALEIAAELVKMGAKPSLIADAVATREFEDIRRMAKAMQTIELFHGGKVVGVFLDKELKNLELTDDLIDMIRFTKGVDIAFLLKYEEEDVYRVRMRSRCSDVSEILKPLGGGGHSHAAGCTLRMSMEQAKSCLLHAMSPLFLGIKG